MKRISILTLSLGLVASPLVAQDAGLYPEPSAPDASFVRIIDPDVDTARIGETSVTMNDAGFSPYVEVAPGTVAIALGDGSESFEVGANSHYTVVAGDGEVALTEDPIEESPAQANLLVYNLGDLEDFDVYAVEAETAALSDVAPGGHDGVALKAPLTLTFELRQDDDTLASLEPMLLERGTGSTVVVNGTGDVVTLKADTNTYQQ